MEVHFNVVLTSVLDGYASYGVLDKTLYEGLDFAPNDCKDSNEFNFIMNKILIR